MDIESLCKKLDDAIYEDAIDPKVKLIRELNSHKDKFVVFKKPKIMSAIQRSLVEDFKKSPDYTRAVLAFLRTYLEAAMNPVEDEEVFELMNTLIKIQAFENKRYEKLREKHTTLKKKAATKNSFADQFVKEVKFMNTIIAKQNQIFYLSLLIAQIISNFARDLDPSEVSLWQQAQAQMHQYLKLIVSNLDRHDQAVILLTLETISEFVREWGIPNDMKSTYLSLRLQKFFDSLVYMSPYLIFAQLFVRGAFTEAELKLVVPSILASSNDKHFRDNIINLVSLISANGFVKEVLIEKEYYLGILGMYLSLVEKKMAKGETRFDKFDLMRGLINSMINLANEPAQANLMIKNPLFKKLLQFAFETKDVGLLKLVNNITGFCDPQHTLVLREKVLKIRDLVVEANAGTHKQKRQMILEMFGILSNCCLSEAWEGFLNKDFFVILTTNLQGEDHQMRLQAILLVAQLCRCEKAITLLKNKGALDMIFLPKRRVPDREELFQKLFVAYHLILMDFNVDDFIQEILDLVNDFLDNEFTKKNIRVVSFLNEFLFILQIKQPKNPLIEELVIKRYVPL